MIVLFGFRNNPTSEILNNLDLVKMSFRSVAQPTVNKVVATLERYSQPT